MGQSQAVVDWLSQRVDFTLSPHTLVLYATETWDGPILGAIGLGGRMGRTWGSVSIALENPRAALPLVRAAAIQLFGELRAAAAYVTIGGARAHWIAELKKAIGFFEVDMVPNGIAPGNDLVVLKLTPWSCKPWQSELKRRVRRAREAA